jgi:hypothetical protein
MREEADFAPRARIPADVDTPDRIVYGLTARQLAILAVAAVIEYGIYKSVAHLLPLPVVLGLLVPVAALAVGLALGSRDGLPMDRWLLGGIRHSRAPKRLVPAASGQLPAAAGWAAPDPSRNPLSVLRLPAQAISEAGIVDTGSQAVALVACTTVNIGLRTGDEQAALIGGYGRWLNGLAGPVQVVISAQRVDLSSHAGRIAERAQLIANDALADAAADYADFLDDLSMRRDPLWRTVTVVVTAHGERGRDTEVTRRADQAAAALAALGAQTAVLDGPQVTGILSVAVDPYTPSDASWPRTRPGAPITNGDPT